MFLEQGGENNAERRQNRPAGSGPFNRKRCGILRGVCTARVYEYHIWHGTRERIIQDVSNVRDRQTQSADRPGNGAYEMVLKGAFYTPLMD